MAAHDFNFVQINIDQSTCHQSTEENCRNGRLEKLLSYHHTRLHLSLHLKKQTKMMTIVSLFQTLNFFLRQYKENIW